MSNNQTISSDAEFIKWLNGLNLNFLFYSSVSLIPIGLIFNTISIMVFSREKFSKTTNGFHNIILSIVNNLLLAFVFVPYYTQSISKDILLTTNFNCQFFSYIPRVFSQHSSWIYVVLVIERLFCVTHPNEYRIFKQKKKIIALVVCILFLLMCVLNIPNLLFRIENTLTNSGNLTINVSICTSDGLIVRIRDMEVICFRLALPFGLTFVLNLVLIFKMKKFKKQMTSRDSFMVRECRFAVSIIALNVMFLVTLLPVISTIAYLNLVGYDKASSFYTRQVAIGNFIFYVAQSVSSYNYSFTFFVNLKTNIMFRNELFKLLTVQD